MASCSQAQHCSATTLIPPSPCRRHNAAGRGRAPAQQAVFPGSATAPSQAGPPQSRAAALAGGVLKGQHTLCICSAWLAHLPCRRLPISSVPSSPESVSCQSCSNNCPAGVLNACMGSFKHCRQCGHNTACAGGPPPGFAQPSPSQPHTASSSFTAGIPDPAAATAAELPPGTSGPQAQLQTQDKQPEARPKEQAGAVQRNQSQIKSKLLERLADEVSRTTLGLCLSSGCMQPAWQPSLLWAFGPCRQGHGQIPCCHSHKDAPPSVLSSIHYCYPASS